MLQRLRAFALLLFSCSIFFLPMVAQAAWWSPFTAWFFKDKSIKKSELPVTAANLANLKEKDSEVSQTYFEFITARLRVLAKWVVGFGIVYWLLSLLDVQAAHPAPDQLGDVVFDRDLPGDPPAPELIINVLPAAAVPVAAPYQAALFDQRAVVEKELQDCLFREEEALKCAGEILPQSISEYDVARNEIREISKILKDQNFVEKDDRAFHQWIESLFENVGNVERNRLSCARYVEEARAYLASRIALRADALRGLSAKPSAVVAARLARESILALPALVVASLEQADKIPAEVAVESDFGRQKEALRQEKFRDIELGRQYLGNIWFSDGEGVPAQSIEEFSQSLGKILWAIYFDSLDQKGVIVEEMTFQVQDQGGKLFYWLRTNNYASSRPSSHFAEEKIKQYGVTVSFYGVQLPADKQHILFGQFRDGRLFIKPENYGLELIHVLPHAGEFLVAQANKIMPQPGRDLFGIVSDDHESSAKERVPEEIQKEALRLLRQVDNNVINKEECTKLIKSYGIHAIIGILRGLDDKECFEYAEELKKKYPDWQLRKGNELILRQAFADKIQSKYSKESLDKALAVANFSFEHESHSVPSPINEEEDFILVDESKLLDKEAQEVIEQKKIELRDYVMQQFSALVAGVEKELSDINFKQGGPAEALSKEQSVDLKMAIERAFNETFGMRKITEFRGVVQGGEKFSQLQNKVKELHETVKNKAMQAQNQSDVDSLKAVCKYAIENWQLFYRDFNRVAAENGAILLNGVVAQHEFQQFDEKIMNDVQRLTQGERLQALGNFHIMSSPMKNTVGVAWSARELDSLVKHHCSVARNAILPPRMDQEGETAPLQNSALSSISSAACVGISSAAAMLSSVGSYAFKAWATDPSA